MTHEAKPTTVTPSAMEVSQTTIASLLYNFPVDPLAAWMRSQGFDPNKGAKLVLPAHMARELGPHKPVYVEPREDIRKPVLLKRGAQLGG